MLKIGENEWSGIVSDVGGDEITIAISSSYMFEDILALMKDVKEITDTSSNGIQTVYSVTRPLSASRLSPNMYAIRFSTKKSDVQILEEKNQELNDAIDDILIMLLEG